MKQQILRYKPRPISNETIRISRCPGCQHQKGQQITSSDVNPPELQIHGITPFAAQKFECKTTMLLQNLLKRSPQVCKAGSTIIQLDTDNPRYRSYRTPSLLKFTSDGRRFFMVSPPFNGNLLNRCTCNLNVDASRGKRWIAALIKIFMGDNIGIMAPQKWIST